MGNFIKFYYGNLRLENQVQGLVQDFKLCPFLNHHSGIKELAFVVNVNFW